MVDVYSCGRSCSYIILFQHFDWCAGTKAAFKTGLPLVTGVCRVVSKDPGPAVSPGYNFRIGNKRKKESKELPSHSIHGLLTAYTHQLEILVTALQLACLVCTMEPQYNHS